MTVQQIDQLRDELARSGLLSAPYATDGIVIGAARLPAAGADIMVNVDPDLEEQPELDAGALIAAVERVLTLTTAQWRQIVDVIAEDIEEAVGDEQVIETTDLRDDLAVRSVVVLPDAVLLSFAAPKQFPDSWIRAQLDDDFEVVEVIVDEKDDGIETVEFASADDLLDHLSETDES
ncbi:cytochrome C5 [Nannocystis pusilla]|uniref:cytochrome C5 n=1 Tax=Nannocystis pusilla TaxID=889268 RepID=UPI003DA277FD